MDSELILAVNPGSTSTKMAVYRGEEALWEHTETHESDATASYGGIIEQLEFRQELIQSRFREAGFTLDGLAAIVGRGGLVRPIPSGTYLVDEALYRDLEKGASGGHASSLAGIIAYRIAGKQGIPAFIVDPIIVDELIPEARISGLPELERKSIWHTLNQKASARKAAGELGRSYHEVNLIVAHMGGGITVGAHRRGRCIDVNDGLDGEGPFSPERAGTLPVGDLVRLCYSGRYSQGELMRLIKGGGGLTAYLGTNDGRQVRKRIAAGDDEALLIYRAMALQIAKQIGAMAAVLRGEVDAIVLTGGLAYDEMLVGWIRDAVAFLGPLLVYPGENEMEALARGALRVLSGEEKARDYLKESRREMPLG